MRKFLIVLALVLCMALPAAANTWTVSDDSETEHGIRYAVANAQSGDTIVVAASIDLPATIEQDNKICGLYISSDRILTLHIKEGCTLSVSGDSSVWGIYTKGNLTIEGSGKITAHSDSDHVSVYGVLAASGDVTVRNSVKIAADAGGNAYEVFGIAAKPGNNNVNVTIQDSVNITASGNDSYSCVYGIYTYVDDAGSADVTIQNGVVSGDSYSLYNAGGGTITIYAGTLSGNTEGGFILGPDSKSAMSDDKHVITNNAVITFNPTSLDVAQGTTKQQTVSVDLGVSGNVTLSSFDKLEVTPTSFDGITVEPSSKDGTIKFDVADTCAPNTYTFSVFCQGKDGSNKTHLQTGTFTVTVSEPKPTPSTGSASNGGCNAGFAGLALAAFALLAAKRRK